MRKILLTLTAMLLLASSCSRRHAMEGNEISPLPIVDSVKLPIARNRLYNQAHKQVFSLDSLSYFSVWDLQRKRVSIFNLRDSLLVFQGKWDSIGTVAAVDIHHFGEIYFLLRNHTILLTDTSFRPIKTWQITAFSKEYGKDYFLGNPLRIDGSYAYVGHYPNHVLSTKERREDYFSKHTILKIPLEHPDSVAGYYGKFPQAYLSHSYPVYPCWMTLAEGKVVASFSETDSLYVENLPVAGVPSRYFTEIREQDISKIYDEEYNGKLATENCNYGPLLYNPRTRHYYRMFHAGIHYDNKDGTVNDPEDAPKSIIITDSAFHILKELVLPPEYFIYNAFVTPRGLMIQRNNYDDEENIYFDFFDL